MVKGTSIIQTKWTYKDVRKESIQALQKELRVHPVFCELLVKRGITTYEQAKHFFRPVLEDLHDPFLMKNMDLAVKRIQQAIQQHERILIYGDYDVDGTTSVAMLVSYLKTFYQLVDYYVPDRYREGYGLSLQGIDYAHEQGCTLLIALDCGIKAIDAVDYANNRGIDVIICDHHTPSDTLPAAKAILNPKQKDCPYPYKELCGCGIGFKLIQAMEWQKKRNGVVNYLDFAVVSIAADIVPITGENRILAFHGLKKINERPSEGIQQIMDLAAHQSAYSISDVVFKIGPRINAAGRMTHAKEAVNVLLGEDKLQGELLQQYNLNRRELDQHTTQDAVSMIEDDPNWRDKKTIVVYKSEWNKGIVGIVASRIVEKYYKPTVVFCKSNGKLTGSARSVHGFDLYKALSACQHLFENFGGHQYAAGITILEENLALFCDVFEKEVQHSIQQDQLHPVIEIDADISLDMITPAFYNILKQMAPFGPGNRNPVFCTKALIDTGYSKIVGKDHLKLYLKDPFGVKMQGIAFNLAEKIHIIQSGAFDIAYTIVENEWQGNKRIELMVKDIKPHSRIDHVQLKS